MPSQDPRIDAYIAASAEFARPILEEIRKRVHAACPQVEETIKWGMPNFVHAGGILCGMAAFKQHASFGYWKHALVMGEAERDGMGSYGKMRGPADMPKAATLKPDIRKAMALIDETASGAAPTKTKPVKKARPTLPVPEDLRSALERQPKALRHFDAFSPSQRREYIEWIVEAKREETRAKRLAQAVEWMAEGKRRNWKYEGC